MNRAWALLLVVAVAGCLGSAPGGEAPGVPVGDEDPPEGKTHSPSPSEQPGAPTDLRRSPWMLTGVDCSHGFLTLAVDRAAVDARLPEETPSYGNGTVALAYLFIHECAGLVDGNASMVENGFLSLLLVDVEWRSGRALFLLEALADWPWLVERLEAFGSEVRTASVERGGDPLAPLVFSGEGFRYELRSGADLEGEPDPVVYYDVVTGVSGEHHLRYEMVREGASEVPLATVLQVQGGVLSEVIPAGTTSAARHISHGGLRLIEQINTESTSMEANND